MSLGLTREQFLSFVRMEPRLQRALIAELSPADALAFDADFEFWAARRCTRRAASWSKASAES